MEKIYARFMVWLLAFADSNKNNLKFFCSDFAKITFLSQVVYEGAGRNLRLLLAHAARTTTASFPQERRVEDEAQ